VRRDGDDALHDGGVAAAQQHRLPLPQALRIQAADGNGDRLANPAATGSNEAAAKSPARRRLRPRSSCASSVAACSSPNGPTRVRRRAETWPRQPSARPRSREDARYSAFAALGPNRLRSPTWLISPGRRCSPGVA
jgi:hypothetical protein